jgi:hypothetical protein
LQWPGSVPCSSYGSIVISLRQFNPPREKAVLAWLLLLVALACCAAGLLVTPAITGPVILAVLAEGAAFALAYPLGYATIKLVLSLRRPAAAAGRPRRLRRRAALMGADDRQRRHPAAAAGARRAAAIAPLAAGVATAMVGPVMVMAANALMPTPPERRSSTTRCRWVGVAGQLAGVPALELRRWLRSSGRRATAAHTAAPLVPHHHPTHQPFWPP